MDDDKSKFGERMMDEPIELIKPGEDKPKPKDALDQIAERMDALTRRDEIAIPFADRAPDIKK